MGEVQRRKGEHPDVYRKRKALAERAATMTAEDRGYTTEELTAERNRFRKAQGLGTGIAAGARANTPEFRKREKAHLRKWAAGRAKLAAQKKAAKKLEKKKE